MNNELTLLILEDDEQDADLIKRFLGRAGMMFRAIHATTKKEFVTTLTEHQFDVVLADNSLPQFNSIEALKIVQDSGLDIPFILVTGTVSEEFAAEIIRLGADDYILKNNLSRLPSAISRAINLHKMQQEKKRAQEEIRESNEQLKQSNEALRQLASRLQDIREEERATMSREIHDELGQQLTGLKMDVSWLTKKLAATEEPIKNKLDSITELLNETITKVRKLATELRPSILDDVGLSEAMEWQSSEFEKRSGIKVEFRSSEPLMLIPENIAIALFRIYQESLTNVARHANASLVTVVFTPASQELVLTIADNGRGFDPAAISHKKTLGLLGMRERAMMMGGKYKIESRPGDGTTVSITVPI